MTTRSHRYTRRVVLIITLAQTEARRQRTEQINTHHLLLALLREPNGAGLQVLRNMKADLRRIRYMSESLGSHSEPTVATTGTFTPQARRVLELAGEEARKLGHPNTGTEHLLLGMLREGNSVAATVLEYNNVTIESARAETERLRASGHRIDQALPDREAARTLRAHMATREGFPYQPREAAPAVPATFTPGARGILAEAHACAMRANRDTIGAEHLLLALLRDPQARTVRLLRDLGADVPRLTAAIEALGGHSARITEGDLNLTAHARDIVAGAVDEARRLHHEQVREEHFLLSLARDREGLAIAALRRVGLDPRRVYEHTHSVLTRPADKQ